MKGDGLTKMAKEQKPNYSFEKYQYGALAERMFASKENPEHGVSALETMVGKKGLNLGEENLGFFRGALEAYRKGEKSALQNSAQNYANIFEQEKGKYKPLDMAAWYDSVLRDLDKEDKDKIIGELGKHKETIKEITKKVKKASLILETQGDEDLKDEYTPEQVSKARETLQKYANIRSVLQTLDNYKLDELRPEIVNESRKKDLKGLASKL